MRYLSFGPTSESEAQGMMDFAVTSASARPRTQYVLAICTAVSGDLIGSCGLAISTEMPARAEVYFVFRKDVWGHGYGVEVLRSLIDFAFDDPTFQQLLPNLFAHAIPHSLVQEFSIAYRTAH